jgi:DVNP family
MASHKSKSLQGKSHKKVGSKREVFNGTAEKTKGGLHKQDLTRNKHGRIVSIKKMLSGKRSFAKNPAMKRQAQLFKEKHSKRRSLKD